MERDVPASKEKTFIGGQKSKEWAKATIVLGVSFFIIIVVGLVWIEPVTITNSNICGLIGVIVFIPLLIIAGIMGLKSKPLLANIDNGVISLPKKAVLFSTVKEVEFKIKIKEIKEIKQNIDLELAEKQLVAIKNGNLFASYPLRAIIPDTQYASYRRELLRSFLIIDNQENLYFVTKDFEELDEMINLLSTNI